MGKLWVDVRGRRATLNGREIFLRSKIFDLLCVLVEQRGQVVMTEEIMREVWPERVPSRETVKSTVQHLRKVLGDSAGKPAFIETQRGLGYRFVGDVTLAKERSGYHSRRAFSVAVFVEYSDDPDLGIIGLLKARLENDLARFEALRIQFSDLAYANVRSLSGVRSATHRVGAEIIVALRLFGSKPGYELLLQVVHGHSGTIIWSDRFFASANRLCVDFPYGAVAQRIERAVTRHWDELLPRNAQRTAMDYCQFGLAIQPDNATSNARSKRAFEMALALDDGHARAWSGLAEACYNDAFLEYSEDPDASLELAMQKAQRAISLAPTASRPIWITGKINQLRHEWRLAEKAFARAIQLNPNDADAQAMMGSYLMDAGRSDEAIPFLKKSIALNPVNETRAYWALGAAYYNLRQYQLAIDSVNAVLNRRPEFSRPYRIAAAAYAMMGRVGKAREITRTHLAKDRRNTISAAEIYMHRVSRERRDIDHLLAGFEKAGFSN